MDTNEIEIFKRMEQHWWNLKGPLSALHTMNTIRVELVSSSLKSPVGKPHFPLEGLKILDVGCGGGILSEPLARLGGEVIGIDLLKESIEVAKQHLKFNPSQWSHLPAGPPKYQTVSIADIAKESPGAFDAVVASEVLEHVSEWQQLVGDVSVCLKNGGSLFVTTINQTVLSYLLAIVAAEHVFGIIPLGTHAWDKFIKPDRLSIAAIRHNLEPRKLIGIRFNPITNNWSWSSCKDINYALHAVKVSK